MRRTSPQMCVSPAPFRTHARQMREIRFVRMTIVHDLMLRVRSTGLKGTVCVLTPP
jgi:hypothetical protein